MIQVQGGLYVNAPNQFLSSYLDTVGSGHDPVLVDEGTAAEPGVVHEEGHDPGPLVGGSLLSCKQSNSSAEKEHFHKLIF